MNAEIVGQKSISKSLILNIAFLILLLNFMGCNGKKSEMKQEEGNAEANDLTNVKEDNNTVTEFVTFVESDDKKMTLDHEYTNEALNKLIAATDAMAEEINYDVKADLDQVKQYAHKITEDPFETTHADNIKKAADGVTSVLQNMQQAKYPGLSNEAGELKSACASIKPEVLTLDQKDAVKDFFAKASDLLEKMN